MLSLLLFTATLFAPQQPVRLGVLADERAESADVAFLRGARHAVEWINKDGGIDGSKLELTVVAVASPTAVASAVAKLQASGVAALLAPTAPWLAEATRKAAGKLPCVVFASTPAEFVPLLDRLIDDTFCMTRVALVRDQGKPARELSKLLEKGGLTVPTELLWDLDVAASAKTVQKQFEKERPEMLLFDADPPAVAKFLTEMLPDDKIPVVLTPRSYGEPVQKLDRRVFVIGGMSPACALTTSAFRSEYERDHGVPGFGAAEGYEGVLALAQAMRATKSCEPAAVCAGLEGVVLEGIRGRYGFDKALGAFTPPLAVWVVEHGVPRIYVPVVVPLPPVGESAGTGTAAVRGPQQKIGAPFGKWRTRQFAFEEGAQWVLVSFAKDGFDTIDDDLKQLGLSTGGTDPLLDHLIEEEVLARVMAITSTKYGRNEDGTGIVGKSLRICFGAHLTGKERDRKKLRLWPALLGGDNPETGGEAFGTFCRVYASFIRRTIFQSHALSPAVTAKDLPFLDGTYAFASDYDLDKRSELIRALINSYAGSMALTLAHEVGHLAGLGHVTDDPKEIMNVEEGAGIGYEEAHFGPNTWAIMQQGYGLVGDKPGKGSKATGR